jgi:Uma2 family endonuclease
MIAEIIDGVLYTQARPGGAHTNTASVAGMDLGGAFHRKRGDSERPGGWWILDEPELHLGPDVLVPDLAGWRRDRLPSIPNAPFFTLAPDWVCEVASPSTARIDRMQKMEAYGREGVPYVWLVDPAACLVEAFRRENDRWVRVSAHGADERARIEPFAEVEIDLARWWLEEQGPA